MITRKIRISHWTVLFLFSYDARDLEDIEEALLWVDAPDSIIDDVRRKVLAGHLNEGFTYSEPSLRRTVYATGEATSGPEVLDSIIHEIIHIVQHVAWEDGIDMYSEDVAYLGGDISREISDIVCELSCPHCNSRHG